MGTQTQTVEKTHKLPSHPTPILETLKNLAEQRFTMRRQDDIFFDRVKEVGNVFADTSHPVTYGVHSLMGLFANRAGRRTTKMVEHLGRDVHRPVMILMAAQRTTLPACARSRRSTPTLQWKR